MKTRKSVVELMEQDGLALAYAGQPWTADKAVVLAAVWQNPRALQFASWPLQDDEDVVLSAVVRDGMVLQHASVRLLNTWKVVFAAAGSDGACLRFVAREFRADKAIALAAVRSSPYALGMLSDELRADKDVVALSVSQWPTSLSSARLEWVWASEDIWIGGRDARGYLFGGTKATKEVFAGCRRFYGHEARAHWGPGGRRENRECLALALEVFAALGGLTTKD